MAASPVAWLLAFALFIGFTNHGCGQEPIPTFLACGTAGCGISLLAAWASYAQLSSKRGAAQPDGITPEGRTRFMLGMAIGLGAMFLLLIAVSTLPVLWLSACPT